MHHLPHKTNNKMNRSQILKIRKVVRTQTTRGLLIKCRTNRKMIEPIILRIQVGYTLLGNLNLT